MGRSASVGRSTLWNDAESPATAPQPLRAGWDPVGREPRGPAKPRPVRGGRRRSAIGWFFHHYRWRAYAVPVLTALTVLVIVQVSSPPIRSDAVASGMPTAITTLISGANAAKPAPPDRRPSSAAAALAPAPAELPTGNTPAIPTTPATPIAVAKAMAPAAPIPDPNGTSGNLRSAVLPSGNPFVAKGSNTWHVVRGTTPPMGSGGTKFTFTVEVEDGIESAPDDLKFATLVDAALADSRSWIGSGNFTLQRIDSGQPSFRVSLTSQLTTRGNALCGWQIQYEASCYARAVHRVAINNARWTRGAASFDGDLASYRVYAINHEVGHALGFMHQACQRNGGPAPVMMQQSWSTSNNDLAPFSNPQVIQPDGKVCRFNPFPYPLGSVFDAPKAAGAPPSG